MGTHKYRDGELKDLVPMVPLSKRKCAALAPLIQTEAWMNEGLLLAQ